MHKEMPFELAQLLGGWEDSNDTIIDDSLSDAERKLLIDDIQQTAAEIELMEKELRQYENIGPRTAPSAGMLDHLIAGSNRSFIASMDAPKPTEDPEKPKPFDVSSFSVLTGINFVHSKHRLFVAEEKRRREYTLKGR